MDIDTTTTTTTITSTRLQTTIVDTTTMDIITMDTTTMAIIEVATEIIIKDTVVDMDTGTTTTIRTRMLSRPTRMESTMIRREIRSLEPRIMESTCSVMESDVREEDDFFDS